MFNLRHAHAPLLPVLPGSATPLLHLLLLPHLLVVEAKGSSPQEVREVPGTTHVLHRVVEEADGVHNLGLSN